MAKNYALLVDDDHVVTDLMATILNNRGYTTVAVNCGREALREIRAAIPDFVILDINLPDITGFEVLRAIRSEEPSCDVPVFMLTGHGEAARQLASFDLGATEFFAKSSNLRKVIEQIEEVMWYREPLAQNVTDSTKTSQSLAVEAGIQMRQAR